MRPPLRDRARLTFVPRARRRSSSTRSRSGSARAGSVRAGGATLGSRRRRTSSSVWRTDRSWSMTVPRTCSWCSTDRPPSARAWPSVSRRSATAAWTAGDEVEQPERVRDGRARPADATGDLFVGEPELVDEPAEALGRFDRVEVLALQVLDQRDLELRAVVELADDRRDPLEAGRDGRSQAPLPGDELVAVDGLGDEDRLQDPVLADARGQRRELGRDRSAGVAGTGSGRMRSTAMSTGPGRPGARCGMSAASPRPRPWVRSGRTVMTTPSLRERAGWSGSDLASRDHVRRGSGTRERAPRRRARHGSRRRSG